jgi:RNA polymerase sigma factor (sigma-70 family)
MANSPLNSTLRFLQQFAAAARRGDAGDSHLLNRFVALHDEAAFAALVGRYGPMVLGVCQRILRDEHDAEDAFQATFLVLARKAGSLRLPGSLGPWLYGVAYRTARKAKALAGARRAKERQVVDVVAVERPADESWSELRAVLDEEINRLPARYRTPVVLCYLQGKTNEEAARLLGCPKGTVLSRLSRARARLRSRLGRRGVALSAGMLAAGLSQATAPAALAPSLVAAASRVALCVAAGKPLPAGMASARIGIVSGGVVRAMLVTRLKSAAVLLAISVAGLGAAVLAHQLLAAQQPAVLCGRLPEPTKEWRPGADDMQVVAKDLPRLGGFTPLCFSPDGRLLLLACFNGEEEGQAVVWDIRGGRELNRFLWPGVGQATIGPDGRMALVDEGGKLTLRHAASGREERTPVGGLLFTWPVVFSPDGKRLAGNQGGVLKVWDVGTWKEVAALPYEEGCHPLHYWFSPDGATLGAGFLYGSVRLWDVATGQTRHYFPADKQEAVYIRGLSPDLKAAVVQQRTGKHGRDGTVWLWDLASGKKSVLFQGGRNAPSAGEVNGVHFSHGGRILALGVSYAKGGSEVVAWEVRTARKLAAVPGCAEGVPSPARRILAVRTEEGRVQLRSLP